MSTPAITIYDVAREAGVSPSTVSRTFARPGRVSSVTAARVRAVAERVGYRSTAVRPVPLVRRTGILAVVVSDLRNPHYADLVTAAQAAAAPHGYTVVVCDSQESARAERRSFEAELGAAVDGVVLAGSRMSDTTVRTLARQVPTVLVDRRVGGLPAVLTDTGQAVGAIVDHLQGLGHVEIGYVAGPEDSWVSGRRWHALQEACRERRVGLRRVAAPSPTIAGGAAVAEVVERVPVSAVVAYNDQVAAGLVRALQARGVDVPGRLGVVGFDDTVTAWLSTPGLTTVAAPVRRQAATAVSMLLSLLGRDAGTRPGTVVLPTRLVVRGSTGQRSRNRISPASWTTSVSGSAARAARSSVAGSA